PKHSIERATKNWGRPLHGPDASADRADRSGLVPDLRHGARADGCFRRSRSRPRIRLDAQAILHRTRTVGSVVVAGDGRRITDATHTGCDRAMDRIAAGNSGSAVVRLAVFPALLDVDRES